MPHTFDPKYPLTDKELKDFENAVYALKSTADLDALHPMYREGILRELGALFAENRGEPYAPATPAEAIEYIKGMNNHRRLAMVRLVRDALIEIAAGRTPLSLQEE
jgi:hypothetical protein